MKSVNNMWRISITFLIITGVCCHAWGQNVVFTAQADVNKIGIKDYVQVHYVIRDAQNLQTVVPPSGPDFNIVQGPFESQSTQVQFVGNKAVTTQSLSLTYVIQPKHEGNITMPPAIAKDAAGHTYQSNTVTLQVVPGSVMQQQRQQQRNDPFGGDDDVMAMIQRQQQMMQQMMQGGNAAQQRQQQPDPPVNDEELKKDLFIKVSIDKSKVHVGEQITASYKLYSCTPMQVGLAKLPSLNGFWTQDFDIPKQAKPTEEVINGKKYQVFLLKKSALFPQQTGTLELDPVEAKGVAWILQNVKRRVSDVFGGSLMINDPRFNNQYFRMQATREVKVDLESTPVKITVTGLPDKNKPADYGGAVGHFAISSKIDKQELTTDDVATLTVNITGSGNLKLIEAPKLNLPNGLNSYDPQITDTITGRTTTISGTKMISYVISPHTPGDYEIPATSFTYFDPESEKYITEHTEAIKLHVTPGKHFTPDQAGNGLAIKDIHDIVKLPLNNITLKNKPLPFRPVYWSMYAFPLLAFIGMVVWKKRDEELSKDTTLLKKKRANKIALQRLNTAKKLLDQQNKVPFYEEVSKAIWLYLSDKLSIPLSSLSKDTAAEAMNLRKVPDTLQKSLENVMWECETSLYASGGSKQMVHTYDEAIKVISDLEDVFKA